MIFFSLSFNKFSLRNFNVFSFNCLMHASPTAIYLCTRKFSLFFCVPSSLSVDANIPGRHSSTSIQNVDDATPHSYHQLKHSASKHLGFGKISLGKLIDAIILKRHDQSNCQKHVFCFSFFFLKYVLNNIFYNIRIIN